MRQTLPLFWWVRQRTYDLQPHAYVCPLLMTISAIICRLRGQHARWIAASRHPNGGWLSPARVVFRNCEIGCSFSCKWIERECDFWNSRYGIAVDKLLRRL